MIIGRSRPLSLASREKVSGLQSAPGCAVHSPHPHRLCCFVYYTSEATSLVLLFFRQTWKNDLITRGGHGGKFARREILPDYYPYGARLYALNSSHEEEEEEEEEEEAGGLGLLISAIVET